MKKILFMILALSTAAGAWAQESKSLFPGKAIETSRDTSVTVPADLVTPTGAFKSGIGSPVDTIDVGDGRLQIVLKDDHTWYYVKNLSVLANDAVYTEDWVPNALSSYRNTSLDSLPTHNSICLVDSVSSFVCPNQTKVFSKFGYRRGRRHQGVDLPLSVGTPVYAAFDGRVRASMYVSGYGNMVIIRHENGLETYYGHLSKRNVEVNDWVRAGDVIGLGGSTGRSTGPHLHFEVRYKGFAFDPEWIADYETGKLRTNVFVLRRSYLDASSHYVHQSLDEEEEIYATDEQIRAEEERIAAEKAAMKWHTVRSGETISAISRKYGKSQAAIVKLNPGLNPNKIRIGQKIRVN